MHYKTTKQFGTGREAPDRTFGNLNEAKSYAQESAESDASMKLKTVYRVYEFDEVVYEANSATIDLASKANSDAAGSASGKGSGSSFSPTPFATTAKPKGAIQHWKSGDNEDEKK